MAVAKKVNPKKRIINYTPSEWRNLKNQCTGKSFSPFAKFFLKLRGLNIELNGKAVEKYIAFYSGFTAEQIILNDCPYNAVLSNEPSEPILI